MPVHCVLLSNAYIWSLLLTIFDQFAKTHIFLRRELNHLVQCIQCLSCTVWARYVVINTKYLIHFISYHSTQAIRNKLKGYTVCRRVVCKYFQIPHGEVCNIKNALAICFKEEILFIYICIILSKQHSAFSREKWVHVLQKTRNFPREKISPSYNAFLWKRY